MYNYVVLIFVILILFMLIFVACQHNAVDGNVDLVILILALALSILTLYIVVYYTSCCNKNDLGFTYLT